MTGPEHYRKAADILDTLNHARSKPNFQIVPEMAATVLAEAQVHATLALAAATAHGTVPTSGIDRAGWRQVIGTADPVSHWCDNCDGVDPETCLTAPKES